MATGNFTCPDNVLTSSSLSELVLECKTTPEECPPQTDHIPIITTLATDPSRHEETPKPNFKSTDWPTFRKELSTKLESTITQHKITNESEFYCRLNTLTLAITDTIESTVPKIRPSPFTKRWWSKELSLKQMQVRKLGRASYAQRSKPDEPIHKTYKTERNLYGTMIKYAKRTHWDDFLQSIDDKTIWTAHRYASGPPTDRGKARVPTLNLGEQGAESATAATTNKEKSNAFMKTFFPAPVS